MVRDVGDLKSRRSAWFYVAVIVGIVFLYLLISQFSAPISSSVPLSNNPVDQHDFAVDDDVLDSYTRDSSLYNDVMEIEVNGIDQVREINYPGKTVELYVNGIRNNIAVSMMTHVSRIYLNGDSNIISLCNGIHSPEMHENGVRNQIDYRTC